MKYITILVAAIFICIKVQGQSIQEIPEEYAISDSMLWEMAKRVEIRYSNDGARESFIYRHSAQLNNWEASQELPLFLEDFELDNRFYYHCKDRSLDIMESLRKAIFDEVFNQEVLHVIINSNNKAYDNKYNPEELRKNSEYVFMKDYADFEYQEYSMKDLARLRLKELNILSPYH